MCPAHLDDQVFLEEHVPFSGLGFCVLLGFSYAFRVLFNSDGDDEKKALGKVFGVVGILFQAAAAGSIEEQVFRATDSFFSIWKSFLFNDSIFIVAILLMSLLIATICDTYNNVRFTNKEELVKCHAEMAGTAIHSIIHHFSPTVQRSERRDNDHNSEGTSRESEA